MQRYARERGRKSWLVAGAIALLLSQAAQADSSPMPDLRVSDLQAGDSFESLSGAFTFSDFEFTAVGFDESLFEEFLVLPSGLGFRIILGFFEPFGPGSLEMSYLVSANNGFDIGSARIPFFGLLDPMGSDPIAGVGLAASNGVALAGTATDFTSWQSIEAFFDGEHSLRVDEVLDLSGGKGTLKLDNDFNVPKLLPEPATGLMLALGLGAWATVRRRAAA